MIAAPPVVPKPPVVLPPPASSVKGYPLNGSLEAAGRWVFHRGPPNARYAIPDVPAGTALEVTASGGYEPVRITIYGSDGQVLRGAYGIASRDFPAGAGEVRGTASIAGHYQAEVEGGARAHDDQPSPEPPVKERRSMPPLEAAGTARPALPMSV